MDDFPQRLALALRIKLQHRVSLVGRYVAKWIVKMSATNGDYSAKIIREDLQKRYKFLSDSAAWHISTVASNWIIVHSGFKTPWSLVDLEQHFRSVTGDSMSINCNVVNKLNQI